MFDGQQGLDVWKFVAPEFVFGPDTRHLAGRYAKNFGLRKALVVTDPGVIAAGWTGHVVASLEEAGISYSIFSQITPDPPSEEVMAGSELYEREGCNGIIAVGGGSPIDCAKGIGIVSSNRKQILEFAGVDEVPIPGPPLICVPTTAGSSADLSQFAIITDRQQKNKVAIVSKALVPDVSLIDPLTTTTMPPLQMVCTGIDSLSQAIEAFVSTAHSPIADLHALKAIHLVARSLPQLFADPDNVELRSQQMLGSLNSGLAFSNASLGLLHAMAHSLGCFLGLAHGECVAMLLGPVIAFNFAAAAERYRQIGEAMGLHLQSMPEDGLALALVGEVKRLRKALRLDRTLGQIGIRKSDIPELAMKAMKDPCVVTNPRRPSLRDIEVIFEEAF